MLSSSSSFVVTPSVYSCVCVCNCALLQPTTLNDDGEKYSCNVLLPLVQKGASQLVEDPVIQKVYPIKKTDVDVVVTFYRLDRTISTTGPATCEYFFGPHLHRRVRICTTNASNAYVILRIVYLISCVSERFLRSSYN